MTPTGNQDLRILVVEDEMVIAMELENILEDLGHQVIGVAGTLARALQLVADLAGQIDAVILDANLGGASAAPVARALRDRAIPYIVASGYAPEQLAAAGFDGPLVAKPYRAGDLQRRLLAL